MIKILNYLVVLVFFIIIGCGNTLVGYQVPAATTKFLPFTGDVFGKNIDESETKLPRNYRNVQDDVQNVPDHLPIHGLDSLSIAGTAQFTKPQLKEILTRIGKKTIVIDLREETHLIFEDSEGNQIPITAYASQNLGNFGKSVDEIENDLLIYKTYVLEQSAIMLHYSENSEVQLSDTAPVFEVGNIYTEREVVEELNQNNEHDVTYVLLPITDHKPPTPKAVDEFIAFLESINNDNDVVLLFHCQAGRGRTGLFMVMTDMVKNAKKYNLGLNEIVERHASLGSPDFSKIKPGRVENSSERYEFLQKFYDYVMANDGVNSGKSYSEWLKAN